MENDKPMYEVRLAGEEFIATPENTSLYTYVDDNKMYNHVFIESVVNEQPICARIWKFTKGHDNMAQYLMQNGYPLHVNLREVDKADIESYDKALGRLAIDLTNGSSFPEDWLNEAK